MVQQQTIQNKANELTKLALILGAIFLVIGLFGVFAGSASASVQRPKLPAAMDWNCGDGQGQVVINSTHIWECSPVYANNEFAPMGGKDYCPDSYPYMMYDIYDLSNFNDWVSGSGMTAWLVNLNRGEPGNDGYAQFSFSNPHWGTENAQFEVVCSSNDTEP